MLYPTFILDVVIIQETSFGTSQYYQKDMNYFLSRKIIIVYKFGIISAVTALNVISKPAWNLYAILKEPIYF